MRKKGTQLREGKGPTAGEERDTNWRRDSTDIRRRRCIELRGRRVTGRSVSLLLPQCVTLLLQLSDPGPHLQSPLFLSFPSVLSFYPSHCLTLSSLYCLLPSIYSQACPFPHPTGCPCTTLGSLFLSFPLFLILLAAKAGGPLIGSAKR